MEPPPTQIGQPASQIQLSAMLICNHRAGFRQIAPLALILCMRQDGEG